MQVVVGSYANQRIGGGGDTASGTGLRQQQGIVRLFPPCQPFGMRDSFQHLQGRVGRGVHQGLGFRQGGSRVLSFPASRNGECQEA